MNKNLFFRILFMLIIALLLFPAIKLLVIYVNLHSKSYSLEYDNNKNQIQKYTFSVNKGESFTDAAFNEENRKLFSQIAVTGMSPDDIFNQQLGELEVVEDYSEVDKFYNDNFKLEEEKEIMQVQSSLDNDQNVLGKDNNSIIGDITDIKILHNYDDSGIIDETDVNYKNSQLDKISENLDKNNEDYTIYVNKKFTKNNKVPGTTYKVFNENKFYTSPRPDTTVANSRHRLDQLELIVSKNNYYRFEIIKFNLVSKYSIDINDLEIYVMRGNYIIPHVGGEKSVKFKFKENTIYGTYTVGYNPPAGSYNIIVKSKSDAQWSGIKKNFNIVYRDVPPLQKGFSVVNMEWTVPIQRFNITGPDGKKGNYKNIINWISYMDADALWMLVAQTTGWNAEITKSNPWTKGGFKNLDLLAPVAHEKNILVGAYIMSYFTPGNGKKQVGYNPSLGYNKTQDKLTDSYHISLQCDKRFNDLVKVAKEFENNENVDFIGFDFIRTGKVDGYENGPQIIEDMNIEVPPEYYSMSEIDKIKYFAKRVKDLDNRSVVAKWRWWRAHKVASIVHDVIVEANVTKPVWVFTLGWCHGKQHGQDPYMFFDAGVIADAVMLYEANAIQFKNMMVQWPNYMRNNMNNIIIGNACDVRLLDGKSDFPPMEFMYRTITGYREVYREGLAKGIFFHDISRALWSSKRGIPINEWSIIYGSAISRYREETKVLPLTAEVNMTENNNTGFVTINNVSDKTIQNIQLHYVPTQYWSSVSINSPFLFSLKPQEKIEFKVNADVKEEYRMKNALLGFYLTADNMRKNFFFTYRTSKDLQLFTQNLLQDKKE